MRTFYLSLFATGLLTMAVTAADAAGTTGIANNPFAQPSTLPFETPPFDRIQDGDYPPAFAAGQPRALARPYRGAASTVPRLLRRPARNWPAARVSRTYGQSRQLNLESRRSYAET
jgi:hypothetical protein